MNRLVLLTTAATLLLAGRTAWAQRDAASKIDGAAYEAPYFYNTSDMYQQNAWGHAAVLQEATSSGVAVPQSVAREHTAAIRANLQAAAKHQSSLKAAAKDNKAAHKHFSAIDEHHKKALAAADAIDAAVAKGPGDAATINKHAATITDSLKAAREQHQQAAQYLKKPGAKP